MFYTCNFRIKIYLFSCCTKPCWPVTKFISLTCFFLVTNTSYIRHIKMIIKVMKISKAPVSINIYQLYYYIMFKYKFELVKITRLLTTHFSDNCLISCLKISLWHKKMIHLAEHNMSDIIYL